MWRVIPSLIDTRAGTVLAYTIEEVEPGLFRYAYQPVSIAVAFDEDGSLNDARVTRHLEESHP